MSAYGENQKKCQIDTQVAATFGAILWFATNKGTDVIPVSCEFDIDHRGSEYSISVGTTNIAMTIGGAAFSSSKAKIEHISVELYE